MSRTAFAWARSTSARLALAVTASFLLAFVLLGAGVYFAVSTLLTNDARQVIRADVGGLAQIYHEGGRKALLDEVRDRTEAPDDPDAEYAIVTRDGHIEAGTFSRLPRAIAREPRWIELRDRNPDDGSVSRVVAYLQPLRDGGELLTGLQTHSQDRFLALMLRTALAGLFVATTLGGLIGWLTARWVAGRLRSLDETAAQVGAGELRLRARLDGSDDAFDRMARRFNGMLDRIGELLDGVRHATDHIAHDLRTPLTRLRNRLDRMREWTVADPAQGRMLDAAINETDQILQSFGALLRLARIEAQPPPDAREEVGLCQLVGDAIELYAPIAAERRITFDCQTAPARARGDADQLFQLLVNLLDNAVKFAPAGSVVEVCVRAIPQAVELDVADRGSGIDECDRERVFDRFARLEAHRASPGTGLGLSLARAIVLRHEGRIALLDNAPGLRVRVTLHAA